MVWQGAYQVTLRQWAFWLSPEHIAPVFMEKMSADQIKAIIDMWVECDGTGSISKSPRGSDYKIEGFTAMPAFTNEKVEDYQKLIMKVQMRYFEVQRSLHPPESSSAQQAFEPGPSMLAFSILIGHYSTHFPCTKKGETKATLISTEVTETFGSIVLFNSLSPDRGSSQSAHVVTAVSTNATPETPLLEVTPINNPSKAKSYSIDWFKVLQCVNTCGESLKMFG